MRCKQFLSLSIVSALLLAFPAAVLLLPQVPLLPAARRLPLWQALPLHLSL